MGTVGFDHIAMPTANAERLIVRHKPRAVGDAQVQPTRQFQFRTEMPGPARLPVKNEYFVGGLL